ncbi:uncharacterized protein [Pleurodeles waltl]|uniref:uncharacterized protein isoform X4 n=1 Tax=Pleurodeles waltl TaxID=8319 RepID=UPI0037097739
MTSRGVRRRKESKRIIFWAHLTGLTMLKLLPSFFALLHLTVEGEELKQTQIAYDLRNCSTITTNLPEVQEEIVTTHNYFRKLADPPAANMLKMVILVVKTYYCLHTACHGRMYLKYGKMSLKFLHLVTVQRLKVLCLDITLRLFRSTVTKLDAEWLYVLTARVACFTFVITTLRGIEKKRCIHHTHQENDVVFVRMTVKMDCAQTHANMKIKSATARRRKRGVCVKLL